MERWSSGALESGYPFLQHSITQLLHLCIPGGAGNGMKPYLTVLSARFRLLLQYRAAAAAGFGTQLFWGFIRVMIFEAFYRSSTAHQPMTLPQAVTYVWLGQAFFALLPWTVDPDVRTMIRTGTVAYELLRPVDLYGIWYARAFAQRTAPTLLRSVPMLLAAGLWFGMMWPPSWASAGAWALSTAAAALLSSAISLLMTISLLWTISAEGVARLMPSLALTLSGLLIPLPLFPDWAQPILNALPFRYVVDTPFRLYMGQIPASDLPAILATQLAWTLALALFGRFLVSQASRRLVVQGG